MRIRYNVTGGRRKELVKVISGITGNKAVYQYVPTCNFVIGAFTVTKDGTLLYDDIADNEEVMQVLDGIAAAGFTCEAPTETTQEESVGIKQDPESWNGGTISEYSDRFFREMNDTGIKYLADKEQRLNERETLLRQGGSEDDLMEWSERENHYPFPFSRAQLAAYNDWKVSKSNGLEIIECRSLPMETDIRDYIGTFRKAKIEAIIVTDPVFSLKSRSKDYILFFEEAGCTIVGPRKFVRYERSATGRQAVDVTGTLIVLDEKGEWTVARRLIRSALKHSNISSFSGLAHQLGWSRQRLMFRLDKGTFSLCEWAMLGEQLGAEAVIKFNYPDGTVLSGVIAEEPGQEGNVNTKKLIKAAITYSGLSNYAAVASGMNLTSRAFGYRIKTGKFSMREWASIGKQVGADVRIGFRYPNGTEIQETLVEFNGEEKQ